MRYGRCVVAAALAVFVLACFVPLHAETACEPAVETVAVQFAAKGAEKKPEAQKGWKSLFNGKDLTGWIGKKKGGWKIEEGALAWQKGCGYLWTEGKYGNFLFDLEFKLVKGCNSGIFIRTGNHRNPVQTGMEIQLLDSYGKKKVGKHDCGALYDAKAPSKNSIKKPGEWNTMMIMCAGPNVGVVLNGEMILDANLDKWTTARKNPDGSKNKYKTPLKEFPRAGHIGVQDHGKAISFRNLRVMPLKTCDACQKSGGFCKKCQEANGPAVNKAMQAAMKKATP